MKYGNPELYMALISPLSSNQSWVFI